MLKEHSSVVAEVGETSSSHEKVITTNFLFRSCCKPLKSYKKEENVKTRETIKKDVSREGAEYNTMWY